MLQLIARIGGFFLRLVKPYTAWRIFHALRQNDARLVQDTMEYVLDAELPEKPFSAPFEDKYFYDGRSLATSGLVIRTDDAELRNQLDAIPSETTPAERDLLFTMFSMFWPGRHHVFEVGPFLGGTTRAIALGMMANPMRNPDARLFTFDRFKEYYDPADLTAYLQPLFEAGVLAESDRASVMGGGSFLDVFRRIHGATPYGSLIVERDEVLPDLPGEEKALPNLLTLDPSLRFDGVFIDGCKSWYGTKYCMRELASRTDVGSWFLFQDYGWYTCFWVSAFVEMMGDAFRLMTCVDNTYVFQLSRRLTNVEITRRFPDRVEDLNAGVFDELFGRLRERAASRMDVRGIISYTLQRAASHAYLGDLERARDIIDTLARDPRSNRYAGLVQAARVTPTYRPKSEGGNIYLDKV